MGDSIFVVSNTARVRRKTTLQLHQYNTPKGNQLRACVCIQYVTRVGLLDAVARSQKTSALLAPPLLEQEEHPIVPGPSSPSLYIHISPPLFDSATYVYMHLRRKFAPRPLTCSSSIPSGILISCKRLVEGFPRPAADPLPPPDDPLILLLPLLLLLVPNGDLERGASPCRDNEGNLPRVCDPRMPDMMSSKALCTHTGCSAVNTHDTRPSSTSQHKTQSGTREGRVPMQHYYHTAEPPSIGFAASLGSVCFLKQVLSVSVSGWLASKW